jgi:hypothetical protein
MNKVWIGAVLSCGVLFGQDDAETKAIREVAEIYISADPARLPAAFTTTANLYTTDEKGAQRIIPVAEYIERVKQNAGKGAADRKASIDHVERAGNAATVTVSTLTPTSHVTDYLSMLRLEGQWKIVAKTFVVEPRAGVATNEGPCAVASHRIFDFMVGTWDTFDPARGAFPASEGISTVESMLGVCVVHEHRRVSQQGKRLFDGDAYWSYDSTTKRWVLFYIDDQSHAQLYEGREDGGQLAFYRERPDADGKMILIRIAYAPQNGGYTQAVQRSADNGQTWKPSGTTAYRARK